MRMTKRKLAADEGHTRADSRCPRLRDGFCFAIADLGAGGENGGMSSAVHFNFDDAWDESRLGMETVEARAWGPRLRYTAPERELETAFQVLWHKARDARFVLYGSGDFHHLAGWWLRRALQRKEAGN